MKPTIKVQKMSYIIYHGMLIGFQSWGWVCTHHNTNDARFLTPAGSSLKMLLESWRTDRSKHYKRKVSSFECISAFTAVACITSTFDSRLNSRCSEALERKGMFPTNNACASIARKPGELPPVQLLLPNTPAPRLPVFGLAYSSVTLNRPEPAIFKLIQSQTFKCLGCSTINLSI